MTREDLESGIRLLEKIREKEEIITQVTTQKIRAVELVDGFVINYLPRGVIVDAIVLNCKAKIAEYEKKIEAIGVKTPEQNHTAAMGPTGVDRCDE